MFAWLGLLPRTESLASLKKISYFLARRADVVAAQGTRGDAERTKTRRLKTRGFHNVPVLRRQVSKLPLTHSPRLGKSVFNIPATGREIRRPVHGENLVSLNYLYDKKKRKSVSRLQKNDVYAKIKISH